MSGKRMAVKAERLKKSKKFPRYWKYLINIEDENGVITQTPAYGVDLEDALSSVQLIEKRSWLMRFFNKIPQWVAFVIGGTIMTGAALLSDYFSNPSWILGLLCAICSIGIILYYVNRSIEKRMTSSNE